MQNKRQVITKAFKCAFPHTIPIFAGVPRVLKGNSSFECLCYNLSFVLHKNLLYKNPPDQE